MEETSPDLSNPNPTKGCSAPRCLLLGRLNSVCVGGRGGGWTHHLRNEMVTMYQRFPKYSVNRRMGVGGTLSSHPWFNQNYRTFIWSVYLVRRKMSATQSKKKVVKTTGLVDLWGL